MINLNKSLDYFDPISVNKTCHIIGLGAIGSNVAEQLARLGITKFALYDFDIITAHNIANQNFYEDQIGKTKLEAVSLNLWRINKDIEIRPFPKGWEPETMLNGYVFLCVDSIDLRRQIVEENKNNKNILAIFDFRMRLEDAQHYGFNWQKPNVPEIALKHMAFTHDEAKEATPVSACGTTLSVIPTVKTVVAVGIANFINFIKTNEIAMLIIVNPFRQTIDVI